MKLVGDPHLLFVYSEDDYTLSHPNTCNRLDNRFWLQYDCAVDAQIEAVGIWKALEEVLTPGEYQISAWIDEHYSWYYGSYEYDGGLTIV